MQPGFSSERVISFTGMPNQRFPSVPYGVSFAGSSPALIPEPLVTLNEETTIASPCDRVWPLLREPAVVASCIPGAELAPGQGDGVWRGTIRVKFGPTVAIFRGEANLSFDDAGRRISIEGRGIDGRGASRALASGTVTASGNETTTLSVSGEFNVTGPLETFANSGGVHVARALLAEFSANMANRVGEQGGEAATETDIEDSAAEAPPTETPAAPPPDAARELSGGKIIWRVFLSWLRGLFGNGK